MHTYLLTRRRGICIIEQEDEATPWVVDIEPQVPGAATTLGACVNPVARDSGFIRYADSSTGGMQSFTFNTSQKEATKVLEANTADTPVAPSIPAPPLPTPPQSAPVAPTTTAAPAPPVAAEAPTVPPPAPVEALDAPKQATIATPEHVAPPPSMPPVLSPVEGTDLATKGYVTSDMTTFLVLDLTSCTSGTDPLNLPWTLLWSKSQK